MRVFKYHGLGNDYIAIRPDEFIGGVIPPEQIRAICDRHTGVGSDGILLGPIYPFDPDYPEWAAKDCFAALRIYNPDGSEAEKSGNGLRIFSQFMIDQKEIPVNTPFRLSTLGGVVNSIVLESEERIRVEMGQVTFSTINGTMPVLDREFTYCAASIGNPHCIIPLDEISADIALKYGSAIETDARFPNKTNVQFLKVLGPHDISIEIWERGAGYTLASGSSACCCAATAVRLGLCQSPVTIHMPGGNLTAEIDDEFNIIQTGPARFVFQGTTQKDQY